MISVAWIGLAQWMHITVCAVLGSIVMWGIGGKSHYFYVKISCYEKAHVGFFHVNLELYCVLDYENAIITLFGGEIMPQTFILYGPMVGNVWQLQSHMESQPSCLLLSHRSPHNMAAPIGSIWFVELQSHVPNPSCIERSLIKNLKWSELSRFCKIPVSVLEW